MSTVRKNEVEVENLKNVYYSIAVARHTKHLGFTGVRMNPKIISVETFYVLYPIRLPPQHEVQESAQQSHSQLDDNQISPTDSFSE